jgi:hypothetical protein
MFGGLLRACFGALLACALVFAPHAGDAQQTNTITDAGTAPSQAHPVVDTGLDSSAPIDASDAERAVDADLGALKPKADAHLSTSAEELSSPTAKPKAGAPAPACPSDPPAVLPPLLNKESAAAATWTAPILAWFAARTDKYTGLVDSYDLTEDEALGHQAAIYDLSLAAILLVELGRHAEAERIIDTLDRMWVGRGLPNMVSTRVAAASSETIVHTGPNAWVGLAAYRVFRFTGARRHLELAVAIADWTALGQQQCGTGSRQGLPPTVVPWVTFGGDSRCAPSMGPQPTFDAAGDWRRWPRIISTEHVLDVYALLGMLEGDPEVDSSKRQVYKQARQHAMRYLQAAYTDHCDAGTGITGACVRTGTELKGEEIVWNTRLNAADVYYWWVAAVEEHVLARRISHAALLEIAQRNFGLHGHQAIRMRGVPGCITGTDYYAAKSGKESRCRILAADRDEVLEFSRKESMVSVEWTGEAILAHRLAAEQTVGASSKERLIGLARWYLHSMDALAIDDGAADPPWQAFPYATKPNSCVFGGGWLTPAPSKPPVAAHKLAGSVAGTAWVVFGKLGINPFKVPSVRKPVKFWSRPREYETPPCPTNPQLPRASGPALLAAAWSCLEHKHYEWAKMYAQRVLGQRVLLPPDLQDQLAFHSTPATGGRSTPSSAPQRVPISMLALLQNTPVCAFDSWARNDVATAHLVYALAEKRQTGSCRSDSIRRRHLDPILHNYLGACFWHPREYVGEPHDRHEARERKWELPGKAPRLAGNGFFVKVEDVVRDELGGCHPEAPTPSPVGLTWFQDGDAHVGYADNFYFSNEHRGIGFTSGDARAGVRLELGPITVPTYLRARLIYAFGEPPLDEREWLRNYAVGGGLDVVPTTLERPIWLREFDPRLSASVAKIGYLTDVAPDPVDPEWLIQARLWTLAYWPVSRANATWVESGASVSGGERIIYTEPQRSLWIQGRVQVGLRVFHVVEPYLVTEATANPLEDTDWDNNLRAGGGIRVPLAKLSQEGPGLRTVVIRLDAWAMRTLAYWDWVRYVPTFRPLNDARVSLDVWWMADARE